MLLNLGKDWVLTLVYDALRGRLTPYGVSPVGMVTPVAPTARWPLYSVPYLWSWAGASDPLGFSIWSVASMWKCRNSCLANLQAMKELECFLPCWCSVLQCLCRSRRALGLKINIQPAAVRRLVQGITSCWGAISRNRFLGACVCVVQD